VVNLAGCVFTTSLLVVNLAGCVFTTSLLVVNLAGCVFTTVEILEANRPVLKLEIHGSFVTYHSWMDEKVVLGQGQQGWNGETTGRTDKRAKRVQEENVTCADRGCAVWEGEEAKGEGAVRVWMEGHRC
jgi:hypothetical protein